MYRLACHRLLPWLRVTFAMAGDAAWPGADQWPWSTAPATGPVNQLGRPSASDPWGVGSFLSLGRPTCVQCPGPLGSCSPVCPRGLLCCVCGVLGHLAPVLRCARSMCCVACAVSWATWLPFTGAHRGTTHPKPATPSQEQRPTGKRDTETSRKKKKESHQPSPKERGWGDRDHKARDRNTQKKKREKKKTKAQKTHPHNPAKKGWAQPGPGPSTHTHTARRNWKQRGASGAPTKPHTSHKQADTEPQPQTPQTADTRGTTPQTVPKHTHPRPQPGLAGLTKPTPNRQPDPNINAAQQ